MTRFTNLLVKPLVEKLVWSVGPEFNFLRVQRCQHMSDFRHQVGVNILRFADFLKHVKSVQLDAEQSRPFGWADGFSQLTYLRAKNFMRMRRVLPRISLTLRSRIQNLYMRIYEKKLDLLLVHNNARNCI